MEGRQEEEQKGGMDQKNDEERQEGKGLGKRERKGGEKREEGREREIERKDRFSRSRYSRAAVPVTGTGYRYRYCC